MVDEMWFRERNRWHSTSEVPDLPFQSYEQAQEMLAGEQYGLAIDYTVANDLAPALGIPFARALMVLTTSLPIVAMLVSLIAAIAIRNWGLLWGIPVAIAAVMSGSPVVHRVMGCATVLWVAAIIGCILSAVKGYVTVAWLSAVYSVIVYVIQVYYHRNASAVRDYALKSEPVFLYLLERCGAFVDDRKGKRVWSWNHTTERPDIR